jgi:hypothetical protein
MAIANEKPRWSFYFGWVVLNAVAVIFAGTLAWTITFQVVKLVGGTIQVGGESRITEDFLFMYVLLPTIGLLTGILQYILLRRYIPHMGWWIAATLLGWLMPFIMRALLVPRGGTFLIMVGMLLIGVTVALPQWWMLRQRVRHASWWLLACGLGWCLVGLLSLVTSEPIPVLLAIALVPTITTGIACWLLLDWSPTHELRGSASAA